MSRCERSRARVVHLELSIRSHSIIGDDEIAASRISNSKAGVPGPTSRVKSDYTYATPRSIGEVRSKCAKNSSAAARTNGSLNGGSLYGGGYADTPGDTSTAPLNTDAK